jgi:aryl-alcohol dehydrogenase-like predicted oxidoreductase
MECRILGNQGLRISEVGLGFMGPTCASGARDDARPLQTTAKASGPASICTRPRGR